MMMSSLDAEHRTRSFVRVCNDDDDDDDDDDTQRKTEKRFLSFYFMIFGFSVFFFHLVFESVFDLLLEKNGELLCMMKPPNGLVAKEPNLRRKEKPAAVVVRYRYFFIAEIHDSLVAIQCDLIKPVQVLL